jgi:dipeptidyl aminopeptidase/acylaminoacyl peptidase
VYLIVVLTYLSSADSTVASAQQSLKPFSVADDIELTHFGDTPEAVRFSPDGNWFAVYTERGRLDLNRPEDSLRFYSSEFVEDFLEHSDQSQAPSPLWVLTLSTDAEGPIVRDWRWLADSTGVAFLQRSNGGHERLVLADLRKRRVEQLTSEREMVRRFDVRDRRHYVYTVVDQIDRQKWQEELQKPATTGTGRSLIELVIPSDPLVVELSSRLDLSSHLWAVVGDRRFEVEHEGTPITPDGSLALSPDGDSLVTTLSVREVPPSWEKLYPAPFASDPYRMFAGHHSQYVRINLQSGSLQSLTDAPISNYAASWAWAGGGPSWSSDGQRILLPGTFIKSKDEAPSRPCVAVIDVRSNTQACLETLKGNTEMGIEEGYHEIKDVRFIGGDRQRVMVSFYNHQDLSVEGTEYNQAANGAWNIDAHINNISQMGRRGLEVTVKRGLDRPPMLVAAKKQASRVIWDPNPQLRNIELTKASVYTWKDKEGRDQRGGLYAPINYKAGQRYPLVIQTHGFMESEFIPSGLFSTAFAARALAAAGIIVLQVGERCPHGTLFEGPCTVASYESAVEQLVSEGLVDPAKIGIIGFSHSCFNVMELLTTSSLRLKAASITDGTMETYLEYMNMVDFFSLGNAFAHEFNSTIGAPPFGEGLQQWLKRSPGFNLDKVTAPLLVVGEGRWSLLNMWEPYAELRYLHKPVDLMMLNTDEHVLTNPAVRMVSQGGSVDWFRFWLQDYEDLDPTKAEQYSRWRDLRKMQEDNEKRLTPPPFVSN